MTRQESEAYYNRIYQQALRRVRGMNKTGVNISREVYAALFYKTTNLFQIDKDNQTIKLNTLFTQSEDLKKDLTLARMKNFYTKYGDSRFLQSLKDMYLNGEISRSEFNLQIKKWKQQNQKYIISGS